ncbi:MAG: TrmB family transcriptional regulator [Clostridiales bacterium]|nr:TrmB family transcriptional regulator [Clostridiales bacterium]
MDVIEKLIHFGLSRPEANIYIALIKHGALTGYEVAKLTGFSRSNAYTSLAGLVEKGAAYILEEQVTKYTPVAFEEFSRNYLGALTGYAQEILTELPAPVRLTEGYLTIRGSRQVMDKLKNTLLSANYRVYASLPSNILKQADEILRTLAGQGLKIVLLTDEDYTLAGSTVYLTPMPPTQIRLIVDSERILTGELIAEKPETSTCLYSENQNLVNLFKEMLQNEIKLLTLTSS